VLAEIDAQTYKRVDGVLAGEAEQIKNALSSDSEEVLDMNILHRHMEIRDAKLRNRLAFCLTMDDEESLSVDNILEKDKESFDYLLNVPDTFTRAKATSVAKMIHNYLVQGSIHDWFAIQNMKGNKSAEELDEMESAIVCMFRSSFVKRPLQPFGPKY
jgi:hypothetical protein